MYVLILIKLEEHLKIVQFLRSSYNTVEFTPIYTVYLPNPTTTGPTKFCVMLSLNAKKGDILNKVKP